MNIIGEGRKIPLFLFQILKKKRKMQQALVIYTKDNCPQCTMTKARLEANNISFKEIKLYDAPEKLEAFKAMGFRTAPILDTNGQYVDFNQLDTVIEQYKSPCGL